MESFEWEKALGEMAGQLKALANSSEVEFLAVGGLLEGYYHQARSIHEMGASTAMALSSDSMSGAIAQLRLMVEMVQIHLEGFHGQLSGKMARIANIRKSLLEARKMMADFERLEKYLRMVGLNVKIAGAGMEHRGQGSEILAEQVTQKATVLSSRLKAILEKMDLLLEVVERVGGRLRQLENEGAQNGEAVIKNIHLGLSGLVEEQRRSHHASEQIATRFKEISNGVNEVIVSMQFHDITRQQIERVAAVLEQGPGMCGHGHVLKTIQIQSGHLEWARKELVSAVGDISGSLKNISAHVREVLSDSMEMIGLKGNSGYSHLAGLEIGLEAATESLSRHHSIQTETGEMVEALTGAIQDSSLFLAEVDLIAYELRLMALNTRIRAGYYGRGGKTINVLAKDIDRLSQEVFEIIQSISGQFQWVSQELALLAEGAEPEGAPGGQAGEAVRLELRGLLDKIKQTDQEVIGKFREMEQVIHQLTHEIEGRAASIRVDKVVGNAIESSLDRLERIGLALLQHPHYNESRPWAVENGPEDGLFAVRFLPQVFHQQWRIEIGNHVARLEQEHVYRENGGGGQGVAGVTLF